MANKKSASHKKKQNKSWIIKVILSTVLIFFGLIAVFYFSVFAGVFGKLPTKTDLKQIQNSIASEVITSDRKIIGRYYYENRTNTHINNIPNYLLEALVATEDARFYAHNGIDYRSLCRVLFKSILLFDRSAGGGSTITQQLAKNIYDRSDFGFLSMPVAKAREITIATRMEKVYSKDEILELYLNTVPFGENTYGIETASLVFFNKKPQDLTVQEAATLIGLLKANYTYNPRVHTEASKRRRNIVLAQMVKYDYLKPQKADSIKNLPLEIDYHPLKHDEGLAPYYREFLRGEATKILEGISKEDGSSYNIYSDGLKIYTTINSKMQQYAEEATNKSMYYLQKEFDNHWRGMEPWKKDIWLAKQQIKQSTLFQNLKKRGLSDEEAIKEMQKKHLTKVFALSGEVEMEISPLDSILHHFRYLQNGFLVVNSHSGEILAWVGGINYKYFKYDHVLAKRQVGSTFKPVVYATAIENGSTPCDFYGNDSIVYEEYDDWCPANSNGKYGGYYSIKGGLANSVNTVSVSLLMEQGFENVIHTARKMGITSSIPQVPSIALGSAEMSLFEMVYAYTAFANEGKPVQPMHIRRIEDQYGKVIYNRAVEVNDENAFSPQTAATMLAMLQQVVEHGTAHSLRTTFNIEGEMAGKTGTTNNNTDGWFIGVTPVFVLGAWVGGDNSTIRFRTTGLGQGAHTALPICARFLQKLYNDPFYRSLPRASFNISPEVYAQLECEDFKEELDSPLLEDIFEKPAETIENFFKKIFGRKKKGN